MCWAAQLFTQKDQSQPQRLFGTFVQAVAAVCGARTRGSYLRDKFHRLRARMGPKKAAVAIAHKILVAAFHMLQRAVAVAFAFAVAVAFAFADLGADYLDRVDKYRTAKRLVRRLDALGYDVMLRSTSCSGPRRQPEPRPWHISTLGPVHRVYFRASHPDLKPRRLASSRR